MKLKERLISEQNILKANIKNNLMTKTAMKSYSLAEMKDKYIGKKGTTKRDIYEHELRTDVLRRTIKATKRKHKMNFAKIK